MSSISVARSAAGFVVRVVHHGTLRESRTLAEFAAQIPPGGELALDLSAVDYLDSTFLGSLMGLHKRFNLSHQGSFRICGPLEAVRRLMGKTRLDTILPLQSQVPPPISEPYEIPIALADAATLVPFIAEAHRKLAELGGPDSPAFAAVADRLEEESGRHLRGPGA